MLFFPLPCEYWIYEKEVMETEVLAGFDRWGVKKVSLCAVLVDSFMSFLRPVSYVPLRRSFDEALENNNL